MSQLLSRKKAPPAPERTDIYDEIGRFLKLPPGKLSGLADLQRKQDSRRRYKLRLYLCSKRFENCFSKCANAKSGVRYALFSIRNRLASLNGLLRRNFWRWSRV